MLKHSGLILVFILMLTSKGLAGQHYFNFEKETNSIVLIQNLDSSFKKIKPGDIAHVKVGNRYVIKEDLQHWLSNTNHLLVNIQEEESTLNFQIIKSSTNFSEEKLVITIDNSNFKKYNDVLNNAWRELVQGKKVQLILKGEAITILSLEGFENNWKMRNTIYTQNGKEKIHHLQNLGATFQINQSDLIKYNISEDSLVLDTIIIE